MSNDLRSYITGQRREEEEEDEEIREIHTVTPPPPPPPPTDNRRRDQHWETHSRRSYSSVSMASTEENFTSMSREFSALVLAGSSINAPSYSTAFNGHVDNNEGGSNNYFGLGRIGEEEPSTTEESNPLAIVPDHNPVRRGGDQNEVVSVQRVKKEEVESKISAWQSAKIAKINNRFKREDAVITAWETHHLHKSNSWMKKVERKLEEKRARALEKMQNDVAKARRKAEEKRASAESKRGTKVAKVLEIASLMRAVGKFPPKRSFF